MLPQTNGENEGPFALVGEPGLIADQAAAVAALVQNFISAPITPPEEYPSFGHHFSKLGQRGLRLSFGRLHTDAAFEIRTAGEDMVFSLRVAEEIWAALCAMTNEQVDPHAVFRSVLTLFVLHEIRHISQGLSCFQDIQGLKAIEQRDLVAQYDFLADVDAAKAYAVYRCFVEGARTPGRFLEHFKQALFLNARFCIPLFGFQRAAYFKMGRAIGLLLMLARASLIESLLSAGKPVDHLHPITTGLFVRPNSAFTEASIQWTGQDWSLAAIECDPPDEWLEEIATKIEANDIDAALEIAIRYLRNKPAYWGR